MRWREFRRNDNHREEKRSRRGEAVNYEYNDGDKKKVIISGIKNDSIFRIHYGEFDANARAIRRKETATLLIIIIFPRLLDSKARNL